MKQLSVFRLDQTDRLVKPREFFDITEFSPALNVFADFRHYEPQTLRVDTPAVEAAEVMIREGAHHKLVVATSGEFVGLIDSERLSEQHILVAGTLQGVHRRELRLNDMMLPRAELPAIAYQELRDAKVADLVRMFKTSGQNYCLVLDQDRHHIRGLISSAEIADRLHQAIQVAPKPTIGNLFAGGHRQLTR